MDNKQLALLFGIMAANFTIALGVLPFLPLYATTNLGIDSTQTGIFLATTSIALTIGTIGGGWLSDKFQRRKLLIIISSVIGFPSFFLIGTASNIWQLTIFASIAWLAFGTGITMVRIMGGILANESERGRVFGIIGAATPLGALIGGVISGRIVDRWSISTLFMIMSFGYIFQFLSALFIDEVSTTDAQKETVDKANDIRLGMSFWLLTLSSIIAFIAVSAIMMGRPLVMDELGFDGTAISGVLVAGGLITLPLTFVIGWLSDIFERKKLLIVCYLIATMGMLILVFSELLWHFWLSEIFIAFVGITVVVGSALITDIVPKEALDRAISRFSAAAWIGSIIGFAIIGYIIDWLGISIMFGIAAALMFISLLAIVPIQQSKAK